VQTSEKEWHCICNVGDALATIARHSEPARDERAGQTFTLTGLTAQTTFEDIRVRSGLPPCSLRVTMIRAAKAMLYDHMLRRSCMHMSPLSIISPNPVNARMPQAHAPYTCCRQVMLPHEYRTHKHVLTFDGDRTPACCTLAEFRVPDHATMQLMVTQVGD